MHYSPSFAKVSIAALLIFYLLAATVGVLLIHLNVIQHLQQHHLLRTHLMCAGFGVIGASMAAIRKFYSALITESRRTRENTGPYYVDWSPGWLFYYATRPILGGFLGALSYLFLYGGFQILASTPKSEISNEGNLILYALSMLAGFSVSQVMTRIEQVAEQVFQRNDKP